MARSTSQVASKSISYQGRYQLVLSKGPEYLQQRHEIALGADGHVEVFRLERWIDMPARGWYSADGHIHLRRSPRENPHILNWIAAEDLQVGALLQMGDAWTTHFLAVCLRARRRVYEERRPAS